MLHIHLQTIRIDHRAGHPPLLECLTDKGFRGSEARAQSPVQYVHAGTVIGDGSSPSSPFSYDQFNTIASTGALIPGTTYQFLSGVYEGTLTVSGTAGTQADPVILEPMPGAEVLFAGSRTVPGGWSWEPACSCWSTTNLPPGTGHVFNLYDGTSGSHVLQQLARRSNSGFSTALGLTPLNQALGPPGLGELVDPSLPDAAVDDLTGVRILYRYANWGYGYTVVTDHNTGTLDGVNYHPRLEFHAVPTADGYPGTWGYQLLDRLDFLDSEGEWYFDRQSQPPVLYYNNGSSVDPPSAVRVSTDDGNRGIILDRLMGQTPNSWVTIRDFTFEHFDDELYPPLLNTQYTLGDYFNNSTNYPRGTGILIERGAHTHITIQGCTFRDLRIGVDNAMPAPYCDHISYLGNHFERVYCNGLRCAVFDATVEGNTFKDIARIPGQTYNGFAAAAGLIMASKGLQVRNNLFEGMGGTGISLGNVERVVGDPEANVVEHNYFGPSQLVLNDHAAITFDGCEALIIRENVITDMTPDVTTSAGGDFQSDKTVGLYYGYRSPMDEVVVLRNVITAVGNGITADHAQGFTGNAIRDNTVFGAREFQLAVLDRGHPNSAYIGSYDTEFTGNILYCTAADQRALWMQQLKANTWAGTEPLVNFGTFANNHYFNPFSDTPVQMQLEQVPVQAFDLAYFGPDTPLDLTLEAWRQLPVHSGSDPGSSVHPLRLSDQWVDAVLATGVIVQNGDLDNGVSGWGGLYRLRDLGGRRVAQPELYLDRRTGRGHLHATRNGRYLPHPHDDRHATTGSPGATHHPAWQCLLRCGAGPVRGSAAHRGARHPGHRGIPGGRGVRTGPLPVPGPARSTVDLRGTDVARFPVG